MWMGPGAFGIRQDGQRTSPYAGQGRSLAEGAVQGNAEPMLCVTDAVDFAYRIRSVKDSYQQEHGLRVRR